MANDKRFTAAQGKYYVKTPGGTNPTEIGVARNITYNESLNVVSNKSLGSVFPHSNDTVGGSVTVNIGHYMINPKLHPLASLNAAGKLQASPNFQEATSVIDYANWLVFGASEIMLEIDRNDIVYTGTTPAEPTPSLWIKIDHLRMTSREISFNNDDYVTGSASFVGTEPALGI